MKRLLRLLTTTHEVIDELGGVPKLARDLGFKSDTVVYNWLADGFPARSYVVIQTMLREKGCKASDSLFPKMIGTQTASDQMAVA